MTTLTRASALYGFHQFATAQGLNCARMLREAGLPQDVLEQPDNLIPYPGFGRLLELCAQTSNDPLFGLKFGIHQGVGIFGSLLYLARNALNVGGALQDLAQFFHIHNNTAEVVVQIEGEHAMLGYSSHTANMPGNRQINELALGVGQQLMRTLVGSRWQPTAISFQHAAQVTPASYRRLLGLTPRFNGQFDGWMFDARLLAVPLSDADPELHRLMAQHLGTLSEMRTDELPTYVQRLLRNFLPNGRVTMEYIADFIQLSPRSLQRHLAMAGTSFQALLDQTRQSMAERYLKESDINLTQLAEILGYCDQSAFTRAFQRWYGVSPRRWIKQHNLRPTMRIIKR